MLSVPQCRIISLVRTTLHEFGFRLYPLLVIFLKILMYVADIFDNSCCDSEHVFHQNIILLLTIEFII